MHTLVGDGVANTEVGLLLHHLKESCGVSLKMVQEFCRQCQLPQMHGKFNVEWLRDSRLKSSTLSSFASTMLSIIPLLALFLDHYEVKSHCPDHVRCFKMLHSIISLLRLSPSKVPDHTSSLVDMIKAHHELFINIYGEDQLKPKWHQLHHIVDSFTVIGKCLSCFVTERKHKQIKKSAVNVFRNFEHTTLLDSLNNQVQQFADGNDLFKVEFLSKVKLQKVVTTEGDIICSTGSLICEVGELFPGDVIFLKSGVVLQVSVFFQYGDGDFAIQGKALHAVEGQCDIRSLVEFTDMFAKPHDIADACIFFAVNKDVIKLCVPPHALF